MTLELEEVVGLISKQPASEFVASLKGDNGEWKPKDEILAELKKADKERLDTIAKGESGKAVRLRMKQAQKFLREQYGIESDTDELEDHIKLLVEKVGKPGQEKIVEKLVELNEETALSHPVVKALLKGEVQKSTAELNKLLEDERGKLKTYIETQEAAKLDAVLIQDAEKYLVANKAALDKDPEIRAKQVKRFVAGLKTDYKFKLENGKPIPIDANGDPLAIDYKDISYADLVKQENIFGVHNYDPDKASAGASSQPPQNRGQKYDGVVPKNMEEFTAMLSKEPDARKREAIKEAFKASQQK